MKLVQDINVEFDKRKADIAGVEIFLNLIKTRKEITADDFVAECRKIDMAPTHIGRICGGLVKSFTKNGYLKKTGTFKVSERNSKPLPVYITCPSKQGK